MRTTTDGGPDGVLGATPADRATGTARLTVTQRALVVQCVNGAAVPADRRSWTVTDAGHAGGDDAQPAAPGMAPAGDSDPGTAIVRFTPEPGHRYEVEVRADADHLLHAGVAEGRLDAGRARPHRPIAIVSGDPEWAAPPCQPRALTSSSGQRRLEPIDQRVEVRHQGANGGRLPTNRRRHA